MNDGIIKALVVERDALKRKFDAINATLRAYGALEDDESSPSSEQSSKKPGKAPSETTIRMKDIAKYMIHNNKGRPVPTRDILQEITNQGIKVWERKAIPNLSSLLSHSEEFESLGREGWVLKNNEGSGARTSEPSNQPDGDLLSSTISQ